MHPPPGFAIELSKNAESLPMKLSKGIDKMRSAHSEEFFTGTDNNARYPMLELAVEALYHVGIISLQPEAHVLAQWSYDAISVSPIGRV